MPTKYDDKLSVQTIYAAEGVVRKILATGGTVDFHGSTLDLRDCRTTTFAPAQIHLMQGMANGLYARHRTPATREQPPTIRPSDRMMGRAEYRPGTHLIVLPRYDKWGWSALVLLHELAHSLCGGAHNQRTAHGHEWRRTFATLASEAIGPEAGLLLMDALDL